MCKQERLASHSPLGNGLTGGKVVAAGGACVRVRHRVSTSEEEEMCQTSANGSENTDSVPVAAAFSHVSMKL